MACTIRNTPGRSPSPNNNGVQALFAGRQACSQHTTMLAGKVPNWGHRRSRQAEAWAGSGKAQQIRTGRQKSLSMATGIIRHGATTRFSPSRRQETPITCTGKVKGIYMVGGRVRQVWGGGGVG